MLRRVQQSCGKVRRVSLRVCVYFLSNSKSKVEEAVIATKTINGHNEGAARKGVRQVQSAACLINTLLASHDHLAADSGPVGGNDGY